MAEDDVRRVAAAARAEHFDLDAMDRDGVERVMKPCDRCGSVVCLTPHTDDVLRADPELYLLCDVCLREVGCTMMETVRVPGCQGDEAQEFIENWRQFLEEGEAGG